jgi:hypothetical protein
MTQALYAHMNNKILKKSRNTTDLCLAVYGQVVGFVQYLCHPQVENTENRNILSFK